jgi:hypothetical protein
LPPLIRIVEGDSSQLRSEELMGETSVSPATLVEIEASRPEALTQSGEETSDFRTWKPLPRWSSVRDRIERNHEERHHAFRNRRREVKQGTYEESLKDSPIAEQMQWESVEKG